MGSMDLTDAMTATDVQQELGISSSERVKLVQAGMLHAQAMGRVTLYARGEVDELRAQPELGAHPRLVVVRVGAAREAGAGDDEREFVGWRRDLAGQQNIDGVRGWWRFRPGRYGEGGVDAVFVAVLSRWIVEAGRIVSDTYRADIDKVRFDLEPLDAALDARLRMHRIELGAGPMLKIIEATGSFAE